MAEVILIAENVRSAHNVGSLLRTADCFGVSRSYSVGYTPHPPHINDSRLPHEQAKVMARVSKTSLGAEKSVNWIHEEDIESLLCSLKSRGFHLVGLEQTAKSIPLHKITVYPKVALVVGNEIEGMSDKALSLCDKVVEIPMHGTKESLNVTVAAGVALYSLHLGD